LRIPTPFTQRPWFWPVALATLFALALLYVFDHFRRMNRRRLRAAEFESRLERDRARIARDLHDDLGTRASVINMAASLARRSLDGNPEKARQQLTRVSSSTRELVSKMDELVWTVDPRHDNLEHLASHLIRLVEDLFEGSDIRCRVNIPAMLPHYVLRSDYRHHLTLAIKEALHNALKHSAAHKVSLTLVVENQALLTRVEDDGWGFDLESAEFGHGLANLHRRLAEIDGTCEIDSAPGGGTIVTFRSPLSSEL
jgi:signal transduction histidine kinase